MSTSFYVAPDKEEILKQYLLRKPLYEHLIEEICYILNKVLKERELAVSNIEYRVKEFDSFYEKILKKEISKDFFEKIEDLAGVRIICLYRCELQALEKILSEKLRVFSSQTIRERSDMAFGYMSDHYITAIPETCSGSRYDEIKNLKCEIQVRTVSMHAWATVSHQLDYKQDGDIPTSLKKDFYALSGIFYVADSLFEQFRNTRDKSTAILQKSVLENKFNLNAEFNLDTMFAYLNWKFPDRNKNKDNISKFLMDLAKAEVTNFQDLNKIVNDNIEWFIKREKGSPPDGGRFTAEGVIRIILRERLGKLPWN